MRLDKLEWCWQESLCIKFSLGQPEILLLEFPPDLVVEVISPDESQRQIEDKLTDYQTIGVNECWLVRPNPRTVEVIQFTSGAIQSIGVFKSTEMIESKVLPQLVLSVDIIFAPPDFLKW